MLQALVDKKKVVITEATIRDALHLHDAEGVNCLPNDEIFAEFARMGYEKPSTKHTFYKAFFSSQWKFLIHNILQSMSAKRTSWNEFSSIMASAVICLSTGRKFNFSKYIFESLIRNVDSSSKFYMYPRVGKGFSGVETPLFEGMLVGVIKEQGNAEEQVPNDVDDAAAQGANTIEALDAYAALTRRVEHLEYDKVSQALEITKPKRRRINSSDDTVMEDASNQGRMIDALDSDADVALMDDKEAEKKAEEAKVAGDDQEDEPEVQEVVDVVTTAKLITEAVTAASESVTAASTTIAAAELQDPKEESTTIIPVETKSKDKGKGIMVEEPKPLKKKEQVKMDEEYARKLHKELNKDIDWNVAIDHVKHNAKEDPFVQRYQVMKKRPQTEAQAQRNMIMYLKNLKEQLEKEENIAIESINETLAQKAAKRRKLNEEVEDLKRHLEIMPDEDDDVYTEATPLGRKVPVVDYEIIRLKNKPHYKIILADGTHQLWISSSLEESKDYPWSSKVEKRYQLSRFILDQMLNAVRLRVEEQSEMSLELLRFTRQ
nr:synaptobrevin, longin-like domain protein [Tanacetum cinerariifolium]